MANNLKIKGLDEVKLYLNGVKNGANKALKNTINRSLKVAKDTATEEIEKDLNIDKKTIKTSYGQKRASNTSLSAKFWSRSRPLSLQLEPVTRFDATALGRRGTNSGYSFTIKKSKGKKIVPGAFRITKGSNTFLVARRKGRLKPIYTTRISDMLENENINKKVRETAADFQVEELKAQITKLIEKTK